MGSAGSQADHRSGSIGAASKKKESGDLNFGTTNKNGTAHHSSGRNTSMNQSNSHIKLQPLKEMPLQDIENRHGVSQGPQPISATLPPSSTSLSVNAAMPSNPRKLPQPASSGIYTSKMLTGAAAQHKDSRKSSQEKAYLVSHHHSSQANPGPITLTSNTISGPMKPQHATSTIQPGTLCPQDNTSKNRPQTSFRMATKNTFQMMGDR